MLVMYFKVLLIHNILLLLLCDGLICEKNGHRFSAAAAVQFLAANSIEENIAVEVDGTNFVFYFHTFVLTKTIVLLHVMYTHFPKPLELVR